MTIRKSLMIVLMAVAITTNGVASARPFPEEETQKVIAETKLPAWMGSSCPAIIERIAQGETQTVGTTLAIDFVTEHVIADAYALSKVGRGCYALMSRRWTGWVNVRGAVSKKAIASFKRVMEYYPSRAYPKCKFVGSMQDVTVFMRFSPKATIGFAASSADGHWATIGVDCEKRIK